MKSDSAASLAPLLSVVFFISGAAALVFENVWFHLTSLVFGNSVWASTIVLASFMGGLALGNALASRYGQAIRRPVLAYAILEAFIAVTGVLLTLFLEPLSSALAPLFGSLLDTWALNPLRLLFAFALLLPPTTAMGATLPLLVKALAQQKHSFGSALGRLYGWNTIGAVAGILVAEMVLVGELGILGTGLAAAGLSLTAAGMTVLLSRRLEARGALVQMSAVEKPPALSMHARRLLAAAAFSGLAMMALEVVWFRFLSMIFFSSTVTFTLMVAVVLVGIGGGGLLAGASLKRNRDASALASHIALLSAVLVALTYYGFQFGELGQNADEFRLTQ